jgi:hypothetical protein
MKIYKVYRINKIGWDEYEGAVIVAKNENQAREIAAAEMRDGTNWQDESTVKVEIVGNKESGVVLSSFNAG